MNSALSVSQLTVHYGKTPVLWDVNFEIPQGKLVGIIGPNGAGKSTLIKASLNLVPALSGTVHFFGRPYRRVRGRIAYVPQRESVDWDFPITVLDLVLMGRYRHLGLFRYPRQADRVAAMQTLERVGMASFAERQISQLSGGQQQRIFLARALVQEAELYLLDEPFAGVDMASERVIVDLLRQLRDQGKTVLVVQHDLNTIRETYDWVLMINMRLVASGPVESAFTAETLEQTYGRGSALLGEASRLSQQKGKGLL